jgi:hypothetical protein
MDAGFINNYMVVIPFEFGKTVSKDCAVIVQRPGGMTGIRADRAIKADISRAGQASVTQMNDHICLAKPSRLEECPIPMLDAMIWH